MKQNTIPSSQPKSTHVALFVLLLFLIVVCFAVPNPLPWIVHMVVGILLSLVVTATVIFASIEYIPNRSKAIQYSRVIGTIAFICVMLWWMSDLSPIKSLPTQSQTSAVER